MSGPITRAQRRPTERSFGLSVGLVCVAIGGVRLRHGADALGIALVSAGSILVTLAGVRPAALTIPNRIWGRFAHVLGWINARVLLSLFFVLVLTPGGVVMRLL